MLCFIVGNIKIVRLPKFELDWTMGSVSRRLLISLNFSLALEPRKTDPEKNLTFQEMADLQDNFAPSLIHVGDRRILGSNKECIVHD